MTELTASPEFEDTVDHMAVGPVIEPAAMAQLAKQREPRVDKYAITPKYAASQP